MSAEPAKDRKAEILDTALALAFELGPDRVTTVAIAERLGLTQPAIYRHFRSKADLWGAITQRLDARVAQNIARAKTSDDTPLMRIRMLIRDHLMVVRSFPALPEIVLARDTKSDKAVMRATMQPRMAEFQKALFGFCTEAQASGDLRADVDAHDLASLIMGVLQSLAFRLLLSRDVSTLVEDGARLLDLQLSALAREGEY